MNRGLRLACVAAASIGSFAADLSGTWKLNASKSKLDPKSDVVAAVINVEKASPNTYRITWNQTLKSGKQRRISDTRICDGKEHVNSASLVPGGTTYVCDAGTLRHTYKQKGKLFSELTFDFSPDGKTHTVHRKRFGADGKVIGEDVSVMERQ